MVWALVYLAGFGFGGRVPQLVQLAEAEGANSTFPVAARIAAAAPLLMVVLPISWAGPVWLLVWSGGYLAGSAEAQGRGQRVSAIAEESWTASRFRVSERSQILRITGWPSKSGKDKWRAPARILHLGEPSQADEDLAPVIGQGLWLSGKGTPPLAGALVTGPVELRTPPAATLPGGFDFRLFLTGRGLHWQGKMESWKVVPGQDIVSRLGRDFLHPLRKELVGTLAKILPRKEAGLAGAVLLGIRTADSRAASRPYADLGLAHLFAVSGLHVGILLGIILLPAQVFGMAPWQRVAPLAVLLPVYVLLTGMPGSVVRAASLGFLAVMAGALGRPMTSLRVIGLLFWAGTIWDPAQNLDTGLKLSYLAAGGILAVSSLTGGLKFSGHRTGGFVLTGLAVSAAAQWFTLPLVAGSFGRISPLSPLANLLGVPVFGLGVWCVVLSMLGGLAWSPIGQYVGALAWILFRSLSGLANLVSAHSGGFPIGLPTPSVGRIILWGILSGLGLWILNLHRREQWSGRISLMAIIAIMGTGLLVFGPLSWDANKPDRVTAWQFDVGQGDCGVLVFPDGWSLMVDTAGRFGFPGTAADGPLPRNVLPYLRRHGLHGIDAVVLTHGHLDHTGGAEALASEFKIGQWYVSGRAAQAIRAVADSAMIQRPLAGQVLHRWKNWEVAVLYPSETMPDHMDENDRSLVVVLRLADRALAVWSGDLENEGEHLLVESGYAPSQVQVWKAGHHGSDTSGSRQFLNILSPELVLISCGVGNGYGHPNHGPYVIEGDTVMVARTDLQGSLKLSWDQEGALEWETMVSKGQKIGLP